MASADSFHHLHLELTVYLKGAAANQKKWIMSQESVHFPINNGIRDKKTKRNQQ